MTEFPSDVEQELELLKADLARAPIAPLGMAARLEAYLQARVRGNRVGWEARLIAACMVFALCAGSVSDGGAILIVLAAGAAAYGRFAVD